MILGIVSPFSSQIQSILSKLPEEYNFVHVSELDVLKAIGLGQLINADKSNMLSYLQDTYGNIVVSGSALWDKNLRGRFTELGGLWVCSEQPPIDSEVPQEQYWSTHRGADLYTPEGNPVESLMKAIQSQASKDKKGVVDVSMEDVIKRAMRDLGIVQPNAPIQVDPNPPSPVVKEISEPLIENAPKLAEEQPVELESTIPPAILSSDEKVPEKSQNTYTSPTTSNLAVYLKMKDGTMALFIPSELQLPAQVIDGVEYHTLVFTAPDLGNLGLQELKIQNKVSLAIQRKSIPKSVVVSNSPSTGNEGDLQQLVSQKVHLDQSIKEARAAGDEELVSELRKQRRSVRRQINAIGGMGNATS